MLIVKLAVPNIMRLKNLWRRWNERREKSMPQVWRAHEDNAPYRYIT